jgi:hypothetical protein
MDKSSHKFYKNPYHKDNRMVIVRFGVSRTKLGYQSNHDDTLFHFQPRPQTLLDYASSGEEVMPRYVEIHLPCSFNSSSANIVRVAID